MPAPAEGPWGGWAGRCWVCDTHRRAGCAHVTQCRLKVKCTSETASPRMLTGGRVRRSCPGPRTSCVLAFKETGHRPDYSRDTGRVRVNTGRASPHCRQRSLHDPHGTKSRVSMQGRGRVGWGVLEPATGPPGALASRPSRPAAWLRDNPTFMAGGRSCGSKWETEHS